MRISKDADLYINCRTDEENERVLDILECLGFRWSDGAPMRQNVTYTAPKRFLIHDGQVWHGSRCYNCDDTYRDIIEARDLKNQWISLKKGLDKRRSM